MSFDPSTYMGRQYPSPPCWALVADVYLSELALPVNDYRTVNGSIREIASAFRLALHKSAHGFGQLEQPVDLAVVLLGKTAKLGMHHCGIWWQGSVLHALDTGVLFQDIASLRDTYGLVEFWAKDREISS